MKDEPDIVRELREIEKQGRLHGNIQGTNEEVELVEKSFEEVPEQTTGFFEENDESKLKPGNATCKIVEKKLQNTIDIYRFIFDNVNDEIIYLDCHGKVLEVNKRCIDIFGRKPEEIVGKKFSDIGFLGIKNLPKKLSLFKDIISGKDIGLLELEIEHKDGRKIPVEASIRRIKKDGKTEGIVGIIRDISERKKVEDKLKNNEEKYYDLFENSNDMIQAVKPDGSLLYVNRAWKEKLGYRDEELSKLTIFNIIHPDSKEHCLKIFEKVLSGEKFEKVEAIFIRKDGKRIDVEGSINCRFEDGKPVSTRGIFRDVTKSKEMEKELRESENRLEAILDSIQTGVVIIDAKTHIIADVNPTAVELIGAPKEKIVGQVCHKFICPAEVGKCPITDLGQKIDKSERVLINVDGKNIPILKTVTPITLNDKEYLIDNFVDITELKNTEEKLRNIIESSPSGIMTVDAEGKVVSWSPKCSEIFGWSEEEVIGKFNPTVPTSMRDYFLKTMKKEQTNLEIKALRKDNSTVDLSISIAPLYDDEGNFTGSLGIMTDITNQKKAEMKLKESEDKFKLIVENSDDVIMLTKPNAVVTYMSPACKQVLGYEPSDKIGKVPEIFHPDDKLRVQKALSKAMEGKSGSNFEYRIITKDKKIKWIGRSWSPIMKDKTLQMVVSIIRDITDQKNTEEKIKSAYEQLEKKVKELQRFKKVAVGRELKMIELKKKINELDEEGNDE
jgi:PAS domain S-box-containing protein